MVCRGETANIEAGLIALLLGFLVGKGVFAGSGRRGGRRYQFLAVTLTYLGIGVAYIPFALEGLRQSARASADSARAASSPRRSNRSRRHNGSGW